MPGVSNLHYQKSHSYALCELKNWELTENFPLRTFSRTLGYNVQAMLSVNISRRLSQNIFLMFLENVILEHSGNLKKTSRWKHYKNILGNIRRTFLEQ